MHAHESSTDMYSHLTICVEEVNGYGLTQMTQANVVIKILSILSTDNYGKLSSCSTKLISPLPCQLKYWWKINAHERYMHITLQDGSSSNKKKIWHSRLSKRRRANVRLGKKSLNAQVMNEVVMRWLLSWWRTLSRCSKISKRRWNLHVWFW